MRRLFLLVFVFSCAPLLQAQKDDSKVRNKAIENTAKVVFDTKVGQLRTNTKTFEEQTSIKLHYKVDEQSLNQLGGLSEYLFKIFQSITAPVNMNARTITGEFSTVNGTILTDTMHYSTLVSQDLQKCLVPLQETEKVDTIYNKAFIKSQRATNNYNDFPDQVEPILSGITSLYYDIIRKNYDTCEKDTSVTNGYGRHVTHTKVKRYQEWNNDVLALSNKVLELEDTQLANAATTATIASLHPEQKHVACTNNAMSECSLKDLNEQGELLYRHTGQHLYYVTADIEYFIPQDSLQLFANQVAERLFQFDQSAKYIVAIWLQMHDGSDGKYRSTLLLAQNGTYLNNADVESAKKTYGSKYRDAAYHIYNLLYASLPKPVIIAYQVLKANGLASTVYFKKASAVKGLSRIYINVLKHDRLLHKINQLEEDIAIATAAADDCKPCYEAVLKKSKLREEKRNLLAEANISSDLTDAKVKFKESYLINHERAAWALDQWKKKEFALVFHTTITESASNYWDGEKGYTAGTCDKEVDVLMDVLAASSILLSPVDLDFIPDALTVAYCIAKDDYVEASKNGIFLFIPGNVYAVKRLLKEPAEIIDAVNHGAKLISEAGALKAIDAEQELVMNSYRIPGEKAPGMPASISKNIHSARELIIKDYPELHQIIEELPLEKRIEFIYKFLDEPAFERKCLADVEEVWKWAGLPPSYVQKRTKFWQEWKDECFPGEDWGRTVFKTEGLDYSTFKNNNSEIYGEMKSLYSTPEQAEYVLKDIVESGSTTPAIQSAKQGERFYKIVPKGKNINSASVYYLSEDTYKWIKANPDKLESKLGLPLSSVSAEYDVFVITSKVDNNTYFQSTIAPTKQFSKESQKKIISNSGGRTQTLLLNNNNPSLWLKAQTPMETITPRILPQN